MHHSEKLTSVQGLCAGLCWALLMLTVLAPAAAAQVIEPNDLLPLPPGTNALLGYYGYQHDTDFAVADGPTFKDDTGTEINLGALRYIHYFALGGMPAAAQIYQIFGSESGTEIAGQQLGSTFGAMDVALNMAIWPYADRAHGRYLVLVGWLFPPSGTYDPQSAINLGQNRWRGDVQAGWHQQLTRRWSYDLAFDAMFYGDNNDAFPGGLRLRQDASYQAQLWVNWQTTKRLQLSLGYQGLFGGDQYLDGVFNGQKTEEQRIRAAASYFVTPRLQALLEVNHDVQISGGFKDQFGATFRVLYLF